MKLLWGTFLVFAVPMAISYVSVHLTFKSDWEISFLQKALLSLLVMMSIAIPWNLVIQFNFEDKFINTGVFFISLGLSILLASCLLQKIISKTIEVTYKNSLKIYLAIFSRVLVGLVGIVLIVKPLMMLTKNF